MEEMRAVFPANQLQVRMVWRRDQALPKLRRPHGITDSGTNTMILSRGSANPALLVLGSQGEIRGRDCPEAPLSQTMLTDITAMAPWGGAAVAARCC